MQYTVDVDIMPHQGLLDPQGKAVHQGLNKVGLKEIRDVRIGKKVRLQIEAENMEEAKSMAERACKTVLVNAVMESYEISEMSAAV